MALPVIMKGRVIPASLADNAPCKSHTDTQPASQPASLTGVSDSFALQPHKRRPSVVSNVLLECLQVAAALHKLPMHIYCGLNRGEASTDHLSCSICELHCFQQ